MKTENCDLGDLDWSEVLFDGVMAGADAGIEGAQKELEKRQQLFDEELDKSADIYKYNPNHDDKGRFTTGGDTSGGSAGGAVAGAGAAVEETDNYRMRHQAPRRADEFGSPATNIGDEMMPGFYEKPELYSTGFPEADKQSVSALMSIRGKPNAPVTIYRSVPEGVNKINPGDWVTLSPAYAKQHGESNVLNGGKILSQVIPAKDLWFDGDSINEFGYDPVD